MELRYLRSRIRLERMHLKVKEGDLFAAPKDGISADLRSAIAAHREALIEDVRAGLGQPTDCCLCKDSLPVGRVYLCPQCQKDQEEPHGVV